ncbi:hypothetical protein D3C86_1617590 [compost metagenome]
MALFERLRAFGLAFQRLDKIRQRAVQRVERLEERLARARVGFDLAQRQPQVVLAEGQPQVARGAFQRTTERHPVHGIARMGEPFRHGVARQFQQLAGGERLAEEQRRGFRQLVGFVKDHRVGGG